MVDTAVAEVIETTVRAAGRDPLVLVRASYMEDAPGHEFMKPDAVVVVTDTAVVVCEVTTSGMFKKRTDARAISTSEYGEITESRAGTGGAGLKELQLLRDPLEVRLLDVYQDPNWDEMVAIVTARSAAGAP